MPAIDEYIKVYEMLDNAGPASYDCGRICGAACCNGSLFEDDAPYIYLLPGEKEYLESAGCEFPIEKLKREEHDLPASWGDYVYTVRCPGPERCKRGTRPVQCRTFPLYPYITEDGELEITLYYMELPYSCPFVEGREMVPDEYKNAAYDAWTILIKDKAIRDLVEADSKSGRGLV